MTKSERPSQSLDVARFLVSARQVAQLPGGGRGMAPAAGEGRGVNPLQTPRHPPIAIGLVSSTPAHDSLKNSGRSDLAQPILIAMLRVLGVAKIQPLASGSRVRA
jgi:hypothetical protein